MLLRRNKRLLRRAGGPEQRQDVFPVPRKRGVVSSHVDQGSGQGTQTDLRGERSPGHCTETRYRFGANRMKNSLFKPLFPPTITNQHKGGCLTHSWAGKFSSTCLRGAACKKGRASMGADPIFAAGCGGGWARCQ